MMGKINLFTKIKLIIDLEQKNSLILLMVKLNYVWLPIVIIGFQKMQS